MLTMLKAVGLAILCAIGVAVLAVCLAIAVGVIREVIKDWRI